MTDEIRVLIITGGTPISPRQLPGGKPYLTSGSRLYHFFFNEMPQGVDPDIVVVRNKNIRNPRHFNVSPGNTLLMLSEPPDVCLFPKSYTSQFARLHTCQSGMRRPNATFGPAALPWFVGFGKQAGQNTKYSFSYDDLATQPLPAKTRRISLITSNKCFTRGHLDRLRFTRRLLDAFPGQIDVFGHGFNPIDDKWDALAPYRYAIAIENCQADHYWTEKLSDALLAGCHVIYYGAPNVKSYFPSAPITAIDINNFDAARDTIANLMTSDPYDSEKEILESARRDAMDKYNIFRLIANYCDEMDPATLRGSGVTLKPIGAFANIPNLLCHTFSWPFCKLVARIEGLNSAKL